MAQIDKFTPEIMQMIGDLQNMNYLQKVSGTADKKTDVYGYEFEPFDAFSSSPLDFLETSMRLETEANAMFGTICKVNRYSPLFIRLSAKLEKAVSLLGSCCITKAVLEQQDGGTFGFLEGLTVRSLRGMAAFNFRKCYSAFMEIHSAGGYGSAAFDLSLRWAALDRRLEATAEKIEKIKAGKINIDLSEKEPFSEPGKEASEDKEKQITALPAKGTALPIDKSAVREAGQLKEEALPETAEASSPAAAVAESAEPAAVFSAVSETGSAGTSETESGEEQPTCHLLQEDPAPECLPRNFLRRDAENDFAAMRKMWPGELTEYPPPEEEEFTDLYELEAV